MRPLTLALTLLTAGCWKSEPRLQRGQPAPGLALGALLQAPPGALVDWTSLRGQVVVLGFWATWCRPCVESIPELNRLARRFEGRPVRFIEITDEPEGLVRRFLQVRPISAWIGLDSTEETFHAYRVRGIPRTVVVDKTGKIALLTDPRSLTERDIDSLLAD